MRNSLLSFIHCPPWRQGTYFNHFFFFFFFYNDLTQIEITQNLHRPFFFASSSLIQWYEKPNNYNILLINLFSGMFWWQIFPQPGFPLFSIVWLLGLQPMVIPPHSPLTSTPGNLVSELLAQLAIQDTELTKSPHSVLNIEINSPVPIAAVFQIITYYS